MNMNIDKDPDQLEQEVKAAREELSNTVDALSDRLSPGQLLDQAMGMTKEHGGEFVKNIGQHAKNNPLAVMVTGVGMAWMMMGNQQQNQSAGSQHSNHSLTGSENVDQELHSSEGTVGSTNQIYSNSNSRTDTDLDSNTDNEGLKEKIGQYVPDADQLKGQVQSAKNKLQQTMQEQPLLVGALGVALGAALGAILPPSETEDRLLGQHSDKLTEKATDMASEKYEETRDKVKQKVDEFADA